MSILKKDKGYYVITAMDLDNVVRQYGSAKNQEEVIEKLDAAKKEGYFLHTMDVDYYIQTSDSPDNAQDFQWNKNAEEFYAEKA